MKKRAQLMDAKYFVDFFDTITVLFGESSSSVLVIPECMADSLMSFLNKTKGKILLASFNFQISRIFNKIAINFTERKSVKGVMFLGLVETPTLLTHSNTLKTLNFPTSVVYGSEDSKVEQEKNTSLDMNTSIFNSLEKFAQLVMLKDTSTPLILKNPQIFNRIIYNFLRLINIESHFHEKGFKPDQINMDEL